MIHSVYFLTDVASVTNQPLLLLQFLINLDGWLITFIPSFATFACGGSGDLAPRARFLEGINASLCYR